MSRMQHNLFGPLPVMLLLLLLLPFSSRAGSSSSSSSNSGSGSGSGLGSGSGSGLGIGLSSGSGLGTGWSASFGGSISGSAGNLMMNEIDSCWRWDSNWAEERQTLANCAIGFGGSAIGGKNGEIYVVTDSSDDAKNPKEGTLRWGVTRNEPLWIIFDHDMTLEFENELMINSYKTIDARGVTVKVGNGPCFTIQGVEHVIIHGLTIRHCTGGKVGNVMSNVDHVGLRRGSDGDAISIFQSNNVWIDHCTLSSCSDGLVDVIHSSNYITVSNCRFTNHNKVMLLGHNDNYDEDKDMKVTVVFNWFGPGVVQRMPRVRFGYAHVANNMYEEWEMYAIGGSSNPTIFSEGNFFEASNHPFTKEVTHREDSNDKGKWRSSNDNFENGAFFVQSGSGSCSPSYSSGNGFSVLDGSMASHLAGSAGALSCKEGLPCLLSL